jgi:hypothetical protein
MDMNAFEYKIAASGCYEVNIISAAIQTNAHFMKDPHIIPTMHRGYMRNLLATGCRQIISSRLSPQLSRALLDQSLDPMEYLPTFTIQPAVSLVPHSWIKRRPQNQNCSSGKLITCRLSAINVSQFRATPTPNNVRVSPEDLMITLT